MSKKLLALCALLTAFLHASAQEDLWRKPGQLKANVSVLGVNANYELRLLKYSTLNMEAGIDMGLSYSNSSFFGEYWEFAAAPTFSGEFRQYYGLAKRAAHYRRVDNNAGNFFSITGGYRGRALYSTAYYNTDAVFLIPAWGMQRSWGRHFSFEGRFGLSITPDDGYNDPVSVNFRINFGYIIL